MHRLIVLVSVAYAAGVAYCSPQDLKEWRSHNRHVSSFPCGNPQPRTVHISELVDKEIWTEIQDYQIRPFRTIVHSCHSSGSCKDAHVNTCQPESTKEILLTFHYEIDGKPEFINVRTTNHTSCHCQLNGTSSKSD